MLGVLQGLPVVGAGVRVNEPSKDCPVVGMYSSGGNVPIAGWLFASVQVAQLNGATQLTR